MVGYTRQLRPRGTRPLVAGSASAGASLVIGALGIALGCRVLRAHDVKGNRRLADTMSAVLTHRRDRAS